MTKSDVKKFLDTHRDIELSAARFEYRFSQEVRQNRNLLIE